MNSTAAHCTESIVTSIICILHCTIAELDCRGSMLRASLAFTHNMVALSLSAFSHHHGAPADQ